MLKMMIEIQKCIAKKFLKLCFQKIIPKTADIKICSLLLKPYQEIINLCGNGICAYFFINIFCDISVFNSDHLE